MLFDTKKKLNNNINYIENVSNFRGFKKKLLSTTYKFKLNINIIFYIDV